MIGEKFLKKERKTKYLNHFDKPNKLSHACLNYAMVRNGRIISTFLLYKGHFFLTFVFKYTLDGN